MSICTVKYTYLKKKKKEKIPFNPIWLFCPGILALLYLHFPFEK